MEIKTINYLTVDGELSSDCVEIPPDDELIKAYQAMVITRHVDERMITLQRQGTISFAMSAYGEECCVVASAAALTLQDWIYPQYRESGVLFWRGYPIQNYVHQMFCNGKDPLLGRQMPNHFGCRELNVVTVSSPIGTKIPHCAGCAYAMKVQNEKTVALCYFGEGASSEGDFHAGLNFAAVRKAPAIFFCRNNGYAISTSVKSQFASEGIAPKGIGYGIEAYRVDGNDFFAVYAATLSAKKKCLEGNGPILIEALTYRRGAHSTSDDPTRYRSKEEVDQASQQLPMTRFRRYLEKKGLWNAEKDAVYLKQVEEETTKAIEIAKATPKPTLHSLVEHVYFETSESLQGQFDEVKSFFPEET